MKARVLIFAAACGLIMSHVAYAAETVRNAGADTKAAVGAYRWRSQESRQRFEKNYHQARTDPEPGYAGDDNGVSGQ